MKINRLLNATQCLFLWRFVYEMSLWHLQVLSFGLKWFFYLFMEHVWSMFKLHTMFEPWHCKRCIYLSIWLYFKPWNKTRCKPCRVDFFFFGGGGGGGVFFEKKTSLKPLYIKYISLLSVKLTKVVYNEWQKSNYAEQRQKYGLTLYLLLLHTGLGIS